MFSFLKKDTDVEVKAPVNGIIQSIETVNDPVFSEKMMGDGIAIQYTGGEVLAPVSGTISSVIFPSCHAFGIHCDNGLDLLVHVGLETVNLKGEGFILLKNQGDYVKQGEPVLRVDYDLLKSKSIDLITPIVVTNSDEFSIVDKYQGKAVIGKTILFKVKKK